MEINTARRGFRPSRSQRCSQSWWFLARVRQSQELENPLKTTHLRTTRGPGQLSASSDIIPNGLRSVFWILRHRTSKSRGAGHVSSHGLTARDTAEVTGEAPTPFLLSKV